MGISALPARDDEMKPGRGFAWSPLARTLFVVGLVVATLGYHQQLNDYPPYLDFDSATLGIFVNNESFHPNYDFGFRDSALQQNRYRAEWAASFLPAAVVLSSVQRGLGIPPDGVGELLRFTGLLFGALGTACAARIALGRGRRVSDVLFLFGLVSSLPAFLLYLRTAVPHFLFSYWMFWLATLCIDRYLDDQKPARIYFLGVVLASYALVPYPPILALPIVGMILAVSRRAAWKVARDPHFYVAAGMTIALFVSIRFAVAIAHDATFEAWAAKADHFVAGRSRHSLSTSFLDPALLPDKILKLVHQQFLYRRDDLGDQSRNDDLWTLPSPHLVWLLLLPVAALGAWESLRRRDRKACVFATVVFALYGLVLTVGFPEGRYLIPAVPALAFFVLEGLRVLVPSGNGRLAAFALVLIASSVDTWILVRGDYETSALKTSESMAGMREALAAIRDQVDPAYGRDRDLYLAWPDLGYEGWLYLEMLGNMRVKPYSVNANLAQTGPGQTLFAAVNASHSESADSLRRRGYRDLTTVLDPVSGHQVAILALEP